MPKVIFKKDFYYRPSSEYRITSRYQASDKPQAVNEECATQAIAQGYAEPVEGSKGAEKSKVQRVSQDGASADTEGDARGG